MVTEKRLDLTGVHNHQVTDLRIVVHAGVLPTQKGPIIGIFNQYARLPGQDTSIHSSLQMEAWGCKVDDRSIKAGGRQRLVTPNGYKIPIDICQGLSYIPMRPPTDDELKSLPHEFITSDADWDPGVMDNVISHGERWNTTKSDFGKTPDLELSNGAVNVISVGNENSSRLRYELYKVAQSVIRDELIGISPCDEAAHETLSKALKCIDHGELQFLYDDDDQGEGFPEGDPELPAERKPPDGLPLTQASHSTNSRLINGHVINEREPDYAALS